ncbi:MAG: membrane fusion protein [Candidatus Azotimanducaceae bacterium]|jgi:membrane fusion protein
MSQKEPSTDLFTIEALAFHAEQNIGRPSLLRPRKFTPITILLSAVIILGISFLTTREYTRKETVSGTLIASIATKRVFPEKSGVVSKILVKTGDVVNAGDVLALVHSNLANQIADGTTTRQEYEKLIQQHVQTKTIRRSQNDQKLIRIKTEILARSQQLLHLENQLQSQLGIVERSKTIRTTTQALYKAGSLSKLEWNRLDEHFNLASQRREELKAQKLSVASSRDNLIYEQAAAAAELNASLLQLDIQISAVKRNRNRLTRETGQSVIAPISGTIATVFLTAGETVGTQRPILSIKPSHSELQAELYLPGHAIGFIEPGQTVNLLYDAYPYQQFGSYAGVLSFISSHPITANDTKSLLPSRDAFFLAKVIPSATSISAYGKAVALKEGMSLKADIVLDRRSLLEWLFEPLLINKGRSQPQ